MSYIYLCPNECETGSNPNECLDPIGWCYACAVHFRPQSACPPRPPVTWPQSSQCRLPPAPQGPTGDPCPPRPPVTWPQGPPGGLCPPLPAPPSPHQPARQPEQRFCWIYHTPSDVILYFTLTFEKGLTASNLTSNSIHIKWEENASFIALGCSSL
jgi:hypothetical protein